jgi:DNA ligase 1
MTKHEVMLAPSKLADVTNLTYPVYVQPKYDGFRATYIPSIGFLSRTGKSFRNAQLNSYFSKVFEVTDLVLDGELYIPGTLFQTLSTVVASEEAEIGPGLTFGVFDAVPLADWERRTSGLNFASRLKLVREVVNRISDRPKVIDAPTDLVDNSAKLVEFYKGYLQSGCEGAMIKDKDGLYKWGRVGTGKEILKLKPFYSEDLPVVGIYEGEGKLTGLAGGIDVVTDTGVTVGVGTGFSNKQRKDIIDNREFYIGKIAEIKYMEKTEDGSLRHPVFSRWRDDK